MAKISKDDFIKAIEEMSVLELSDVVKALEEKFGVSAAMMATSNVAAAAPTESGEPKEEQTVFNVVVASSAAISTLNNVETSACATSPRTCVGKAGILAELILPTEIKVFSSAWHSPLIRRSIVTSSE